MMRRWVLAVLMTMGTALWAMASEPPNAEPVSLSTYVDLPVEFDIGQYVTDDDPLEKLSFEVISPPRNGAIVGIPPVFVYIPDPGFAGRDFALILVTDPWGEFDLAVVEVYVASREIFVSPPAFRVNQRLTLEAPPPSLTLNFTGIGASQRIGDFVLDLDAGFTSLGFVSFRTKLRGIVELPGARLKLTSSTNFDPALPGLKTWRNELRFSAVGLTFRGIAFFDFATPGNSYNRLRIEGKLEELEANIRGEIDFSQWPLEYEDLWFELSMGFPCCEGPELKTRFSASKENGFEEFKISLTGLKFGCCDPLDPEIGLITTFTVDSKEVEAIFELSPVWFLCARPYIDIDLLDTGVGIEGFDFFGYEIRCDLPGDMSLRIATSLNPAKNARVTGSSEHFQVISLRGIVLPCCGGPGRWMISAFFDADSDQLFDWGRTVITFASPISEEITIRVRLTLEPSEYTLSVSWKGIF